jgi:aldose 1-epimerase
MTTNTSSLQELPAVPNKASIVKESFGKTPDGEPVNIYTLTNSHGLEARVLTFGAVLQSLLVPDTHGQFDDVVLGFDTLEPYFTNKPYLGAIIGRFGNRIAAGKFTLDGVEYTLANNNGHNALHGGVKGFDKVLWQATPLEIENGVALALRYTSKDGEEGYPGNLNVKVTYTLNESDELAIDYEATTDKATPVNLTSHTYFNLAGEASGSALAHEVSINSTRFTPVNENLIPTGELRPVKGTPLDFTRPTVVGLRIDDDYDQLVLAKGYDHNFVLDGSENGLHPAARLHDPSSGRTLEVRTTEPAMQFYSGNFLDGTVAGKGGRLQQKRDALCFETQHFPDSPNQPSFPSTILRPGQMYRSQTVYAFSAGH